MYTSMKHIKDVPWASKNGNAFKIDMIGNRSCRPSSFQKRDGIARVRLPVANGLP